MCTSPAKVTTARLGRALCQLLSVPHRCLCSLLTDGKKTQNRSTHPTAEQNKNRSNHMIYTIYNIYLRGYFLRIFHWSSIPFCLCSSLSFTLLMYADAGRTNAGTTASLKQLLLPIGAVCNLNGLEHTRCSPLHQGRDVDFKSSRRSMPSFVNSNYRTPPNVVKTCTTSDLQRCI